MLIFCVMKCYWLDVCASEACLRVCDIAWNFMLILLFYVARLMRVLGAGYADESRKSVA